jgi:hypothetical protein
MITSNDLVILGWHHIASVANGGSKEFCNRNRTERNVLPLYILHFNGDNFIMKRNNDPKLTEITIDEIIIDKDAKKNRVKRRTVYIGHPSLDELKVEILKFQ